jgi:enterochelin esterase family protein
LAGSALYAGLNWPQRFGCVLSQSGSYWWPHRGAAGRAAYRTTQSGRKTARGLRIVLEAGRNEPLIFRANQAIYAELQHTQQTVFWRQVDGGHDALCWRGGLTQG